MSKLSFKKVRSNRISTCSVSYYSLSQYVFFFLKYKNKNNLHNYLFNHNVNLLYTLNNMYCTNHNATEYIDYTTLNIAKYKQIS